MKIGDEVFFNTTQKDIIKNIYTCPVLNIKYLLLCDMLIKEKDILQFNK